MISTDENIARAAVAAIRSGDVAALRALLTEHPALATARVGADGARTLLHVLTDWPGHFPHGQATVAALVEAGADVEARFVGAHSETPLHWAASCDDVAVLDALLDAGADLEASGGVIGGGTPLADATAFAQWGAAFRLVERGATTTLFTSAVLGLLDRVAAFFARRHHRPATTSTPRSGVPATAAACPPPSTSPTGARRSTGSRRGSRPPRSTPRCAPARKRTISCAGYGNAAARVRLRADGHPVNRAVAAAATEDSRSRATSADEYGWIDNRAIA